MSSFPDWKDSTAYPIKSEDWLLEKWVWEFLRRNTDYQKDYALYDSLPSRDANGRKTGKLSGRSMAGWEPMAYRYCEPPALPGETGNEYLDRMAREGIDHREQSLEGYLMEKWAIVQLLDPCDPDGWLIGEGEDAMCILQPYGDSIDLPPHEVCLPIDPVCEPLPYPNNGYEVGLRFDLRYPINPQLDRAKERLQWEIERVENCLIDGLAWEEIPKVKVPNGPRQQHLTKYLRAYDANVSGASSRDIAAIMFPWMARELPRDVGITHVEGAVKAGTELVLGGYKTLMRS